MKLRLLLTIFAIVLGTLGVSYASFPVQTTQGTTTETVVSESNEEMTSPAAGSEGKSQIVAAILAFVIGGLGIHRFYLGYTWQGVVQLLTLGGCGVWSLIDLIRICLGDLQPKGGSYAKTF